MDLPALSVRRVPTDALHIDPSNARVHGPENLDAIEASLRRFGQAEPLVVQKATGRVIGGNGRLVAMKKLGWRECDVVELEVDDLQATALGIALNRTSELAAWDDGVLAKLLEELKAEDALEGVGFTNDDIDQLLRDLAEGAPAEGRTDEDEVPEPPEAPVTRSGDLWLLGRHRLLCGDSGSVEALHRLLAGATVHLVNTDPPYNVRVEPRSNNAIAAGLSSFQGITHHQKLDVARHPEKAKATGRRLRPKDRPLANDFVSDEEFARLLRKWFGNLARVLLPGRSFYIWGGYANLGNYPPALKECGLYFSQALVWDKEHPVLTRKDFMGAFELCQPADTQVLTPSGTATLASLRDGDRVVSFYRHSSAVVGRREGFEVRVAQRHYDGDLLGVVVGEKQTWCTGGHLWTVRLTEDYPSKWCVYLMRRGEWWRVGVTKMRTTWGFGVKGRLSSEFGDEAWILTIHDSHAEARIREQLISVTYGIPQTCWKASPLARQRKGWHIEDLYARLDLQKLDQSAAAALAAHHRLRPHPLVRTEGTPAKFGSRQSIQVRASNMLPEIMEVPVSLGGQTIQWQRVRAIDVQAFTGPVHSLGVDIHGHYIADGIVTHNCFYGWREGAGHKFLGPNNVTDLWHVKKVNPQGMVHLTEKPVELARRSILYSSRPGENVLDAFAGSGSTLIACEQAGRVAHLVEIDPWYSDVILARWQGFTGREAVLDGGGGFAEVRAQRRGLEGA